MAATTLDPAKLGTSAVLSNGNMTVFTAAASYYSALSTNALPPGRGYFELTINSLGGTGAISVGIAQATTSLNGNVPGQDAVSTGHSVYGGVFRYNNATTNPALGTITAGSVLAVAYDTLHNNVWVRGPNGAWQGTGGGDPVAATGGASAVYLTQEFYRVFEGAPIYAEVSVYDHSQGTVNFGATGFSGTVPTGYSSVDALVAAGPGSGVAINPHRYWRLHETANANQNAGMAEVSFATTSGGANLLSGSSFVGASSLFATGTTYQASNAVDGNTATYWASNGSVPHWWWVDLGAASPAAVREVKIIARSDSNPQATITTFNLEWADDTTGWQTATSFTAGTWSLGQTQTFLWGAAAPGGAQAYAMVMA